ncbi:hypothetical protein SLS53_005071 [Cytospora paraplurivora]|uniref:Uncharacterized protein n=1 Tax=Cytospora paraplurivora TaxID=2898453 RepID=A0AAN9YGN4_9PEZI
MAGEQTDGLDNEIVELSKLQNSLQKIQDALDTVQDSLGKVQNCLEEMKDASQVSKDANGAAAPTEHGNGIKNRMYVRAQHKKIMLEAKQAAEEAMDIVNSYPYKHETPATSNPSVGLNLPVESIGPWRQLRLELKRILDEYEASSLNEQEEKKFWAEAKRKIGMRLRSARKLEETMNQPERDVVEEYLEKMIRCDLSDFDDLSDWSDGEGDEEEEEEEENGEDIETVVGANDNDP